MKPGKVYLVGAGPGPAGLLTLKGAELLKRADVVVYDRLIQEELLTLAEPSAERIYMGKAAGKHESRQEEVHELLARKAREGRIVVRLKGGDPFLFGRGGEEAEFLAEHGIPFEVIPGVSAALAAPLSAGIAVTHREMAESVAIVTGHEAAGSPSRLDWQALARMDTLVFLMGVHTAGRICGKLIENGRDPGTPCAMIQMAYWHNERIVEGTLADMSDLVQREGIRPPATLVIGDVVGMRRRLASRHRDLRLRHDDRSRFEPAPSPDQLLRLATAGIASQILGCALDAGVFDRLETWRQAGPLALELEMNQAALAEMLDSLVALGLLEASPEGYRNLELASRYLRAGSPHNLAPVLSWQSGLSAGRSPLAAYLRVGGRDHVGGGDDAELRESCEALARFSAPAVAERLPLQGSSRVLLIGWGGEAYRDAFARRWPDLSFSAINPFLSRGKLLDLTDVVPKAGDTCGAILLTGLLSFCSSGQVQKLLDAATLRLEGGGILALHDAFLPAGILPPPEVVLGSLGRRIARGGCRAWTVSRLRNSLQSLGFHEIQDCPLPAATVLVLARRGALPAAV